MVTKRSIITGRMCTAHTLVFRFLMGGDSEVFRPQGPHVAPMRAKFGVEKSSLNRARVDVWDSKN